MNAREFSSLPSCARVVVVDENHFVDFSADGQLKGLNFFGESDNALGMLGGVCIDDVPSSEKSRSYL